MTIVIDATGGGFYTRRRQRCARRAVCDIALTGILCLSAWVANQWYCLNLERRAKAQLEREYSYPMCSVNTGEVFPLFADHEPKMALGQLRYGRLYLPVESVSFFSSTANVGGTTVHRSAFKKLACFPYLERLRFQDCRIDRDAAFWPGANTRLTHLEFWRTPVTLEQLKGVSRFSRLNYLIFDGTGLKGDWLQHISILPNVRFLILKNADLSDGDANPLACMKELTYLQLPNAEIDNKLGPALASLENLECLDLDGTSFDDNGMKHLSALHHLRILSLSETAITDDGMKFLAKLPNLQQLLIGNTKVGDTGMQQLSQLRKIMVLGIIGTRVTNSCLHTLAALPSLESVFVHNTAISSSAPGFIGILKDDIWYPNEQAKTGPNENGSKRKLKRVILFVKKAL